MGWALVAVLIIDQQIRTMPVTLTPTKESCEQARILFLSTAPVPQINYEAVCLFTDQAKSA